ncbi:MAG TPA: hypothetical protein VKA26_04725 [Ignavibacteriaceae bacterium]|nr:hypothetical protein [Ignavibacteriaceae bacterium]
MGKIKIVYLTGFWYSGATILGRSLRTSEQVIYVGEIRDFWVKGLQKNAQCSCGEKFGNCNFWQNVKKNYLDSFPSESVEDITEKLKKFDKWTNYFKLKKFLKKRDDKSYQQFLDSYLKHTEKLYECIAKQSGRNIIIDSSRIPVRLLALSQSTKLDVFPIYVIRDPRGVVNSLIKKDIRNFGERKYSSVGHSIKWNIKNLLSLDAVKRSNTINKIYLSYTFFTNNTVRVLEFLEKVLNCKIDYEIENGKVSLELKPGHVFTGNRSRHDTGKITIREDEKWRYELKWNYKILVSLASFPLYKYLLARYRLKNWRM